jgi:hypothetical protein
MIWPNQISLDFKISRLRLTKKRFGPTKFQLILRISTPIDKKNGIHLVIFRTNWTLVYRKAKPGDEEHSEMWLR